MIFYSHSKRLKNGSVIGTKELTIHIEGVRNIAVRSIHTGIQMPVSKSLFTSLIFDLGNYHDLGKYTIFFQDYLMGRPYKNRLKQHSFIGACTILKKNQNLESELLSLIGYFLIAKHHSNLDDLLKCFILKDDSDKELYEQQKKTILDYESKVISDFKNNNPIPFLNFDFKKDFRKARKAAKRIQFNRDIRNYFLTNYAFSLLIEADKLDASDTSIHTKKPIPVSSVDSYIQQIVKERNIDITNPQNILRTEVRAEVLAHLKNKEILKEKLFTLTAPTGIGKTLTALDFAIQLKELIKQKENRDAQIICALPFINIIEQTYSEYKNVLPEEINLLAHYQFADVFEQDRKGTLDPDDGQAYKQKLMQMDTWQCDVVITSFVQLLQTLIGYRNKVLKKFHHLAGSIIIMDEVQNIKLTQVPLIGAVLYYLAELLDARIILMTATEPRIFQLANQEILIPRNKEAKPFDLLPSAKDIFQQFKRTKLVPLNIEDEAIDAVGFLKIFKAKWEEGQSCLIVCNTVNRAIEIFNLIKNYISEKELLQKHPVESLTTNIIPFHRLYTIDKIKRDLKNEDKVIKPILIATQCVEAGVDLDFDVGFRDLSPIDSIVQVAGRVNRNNNPAKEYSPVYIINFGDCDKVYDKGASVQIIKALKTEEGFILEAAYYDLVAKYFEEKLAAYELSRKIFEAMEELRYTSDNDDITVSSFQVIEPSNRLKSVFIETDEKIDLINSKNKSAKEVLQGFEDLIGREISKTEFKKKFNRSFQQRMVNVPFYYLNNFVEDDTLQLSDGVYKVPNNLLETYYDSQTGFIRKPNKKPEPITLSF